MRLYQSIFLSTIFFILISACTGNANEKTFLQTRGYDIVDGNDNKVLLRGVGLGNWLLPEGYMWKFGHDGDRPRKIEKIVSDLIGEEKANIFWQQFRKNYITEEDIKKIAALGFNSVRPALNARLFMTEEDSAVFVEESFVLLDSLISRCKRNGIYVIIDMHGAPGGQTGANIDDSPNDKPELFMDQLNQDKLLKLWVKIAKRYNNEPTVAAYDLLNEPLPGNTGAAEKYGHLVEPLYKRLTAAIREVDKKHMITVEGVNWANDWSIFGQPFDDNLIYQFHYYCWNRPDNLNDISQYIKLRKKLNAPVWVGETGEKGNTIYWATTQYFEANNIGWSFWPWKKMDTKNTPYSINRPANWEQIVKYSHGKEKPSTETAQKAFDELIENLKLANCVYFPDVVNSIFRRAPVKIEAENYGHWGNNLSYHVTDTTQLAKFYRTSEPVMIELIDFKEKQFLSGQCIRLNSGEWVKYTFNNSKLHNAQISIRTNKNTDTAIFEFTLNANTETKEILKDKWHEMELSEINLKQGLNEITLSVSSGNISFDWINIAK